MNCKDLDTDEIINALRAESDARARETKRLSVEKRLEWVRAERAEADVQRLEAEIKEARNEAAAVRRAYLHERNRANVACGVLCRVGAEVEAEELAEQAFKGTARYFPENQRKT